MPRERSYNYDFQEKMCGAELSEEERWPDFPWAKIEWQPTFTTRSLVIQCRRKSAVGRGPQIRTSVKFTLM